MTGYDPRSRRNILKSAGVMGVISMAGCLGDDDEGDNGDGGDDGDEGDDSGDQEFTITIAGTASGSATQAAGQAIARGASEHSDTLTIDVQETGGWTANLYDYDAGDFSTIGVDNNSWAAAINEDEPFDEDPVDSMPMQGFLFTSLDIHWVAMEGSGIESTADLRDGGYTIYPIEPGFGTRLLTETILREDGIWDANEINNENTDDIPGAVEEGRVDALCLYGANGVELSGWCNQVDVRSDDGLYLIETDDQFEQTIEDNPGATLLDIEPYPYEQDVTSELGIETHTAWALQGQWAFGPDVHPDAVYEMARIAMEHHDTLRESDPTTLDYGDPSVMTDVIMDEVAVHPGMAEFYQDNDIWNDDWEEGEADAS